VTKQEDVNVCTLQAPATCSHKGCNVISGIILCNTIFGAGGEMKDCPYKKKASIVIEVVL